MSEVALTIIGYADADGNRQDLMPGDSIPAKVFSVAEKNHLREIGAIGEAPVTPEQVASKDDEITSLKEALAAANEQLAKAKLLTPPK